MVFHIIFLHNNLLMVVVNEKYFDHPLDFYLFCQQWTPHILYF
jgi:hypothetical protein